MAEAKENGSCRKILVAVDEGESLYALSWCLNNLIQSHNSKDTLTDHGLILLYAKPPRVIYSALDGTGDVQTSLERYRARVTDIVLEKATNLCKSSLEIWMHAQDQVETKVEDGDARDVICEAVDKLGIDLLVMGTHGYGLLKRSRGESTIYFACHCWETTTL